MASDRTLGNFTNPIGLPDPLASQPKHFPQPWKIYWLRLDGKGMRDHYARRVERRVLGLMSFFI